MNIFQMKGSEPVISPEGLHIPPFNEIWIRDISPNKSNARKELAYIYHMADPKSAYSSMKDKDFMVKVDYLGELAEPEKDEVLQEAIIKYKKLKETPTLRALKSAEGLLDKMAEFFDNVNLEEFTEDPKTGKITFTHDIGKITAALGRFENVVSTIRKLKSEAEKELEENDVKKRGDVKTSILDD